MTVSRSSSPSVGKVSASGISMSGTSSPSRSAVPSVSNTGPGCSITYGDGSRAKIRPMATATPSAIQPMRSRRERPLTGAATGRRRRGPSVVPSGRPQSPRASAGAGVVREGRTPGTPSLGHFPDTRPQARDYGGSRRDWRWLTWPIGTTSLATRTPKTSSATCCASSSRAPAASTRRSSPAPPACRTTRRASPRSSASCSRR